MFSIFVPELGGGSISIPCVLIDRTCAGRTCSHATESSRSLRRAPGQTDAAEDDRHPRGDPWGDGLAEHQGP
nr:hypothetical protein [Actinospica robiniae]